MLVYGDPQFTTTIGEFAAGIIKRTREEPLSIFDWRRILIECGQLEQAIADNNEARGFLTLIEQATDVAAQMFVAMYDGQVGCRKSDRLLAILQSFTNSEDQITVKIPEGFAFYALFPEQYIVGARKWARGYCPHESNKVGIIGVRSIGTTLSAVVAAALESIGYKTRRMTVRPSGDPFQRQVTIPKDSLADVGFGLVVDEGPGASGSSMAAVAAKLSGQGLHHRIAFLPGHMGGPGMAATPATLECWRKTPRHIGTLEQVRWRGNSMRELLQMETQRILKSRGPVQIDGVSGGNWRSFAYDRPDEWPAVTPLFERMKFLCTAQDGKRLIWKFDGLTGKPVLDGRFHRNNFVEQPIAECNGFIGTRWQYGKRLQCSDARNEQVLAALAEYLSVAIGPELTAAVSLPAHQRLQTLLVRNTELSLGSEWNQKANALCHTTRPLICYPTYTDGRMGPWEWIQTASGQLKKVDYCGHDCDHTLIGPQPMLWDVAGVMLEWQLRGDRARRFLWSLEVPEALSSAELHFYMAAYAAFQIGLCTMGHGAITFDDSSRLARRQSYYTSVLRWMLNEGIGIFAPTD